MNPTKAYPNKELIEWKRHIVLEKPGITVVVDEIDAVLRRLESLMAVVDREHSLLISGLGDVIVPDDGIIGIGSGGPLAVAAARAMVRHTDLDAPAIVAEALNINADNCVYTKYECDFEVID